VMGTGVSVVGEGAGDGRGVVGRSVSGVLDEHAGKRKLEVIRVRNAREIPGLWREESEGELGTRCCIACMTPRLETVTRSLCPEMAAQAARPDRSMVDVSTGSTGVQRAGARGLERRSGKGGTWEGRGGRGAGRTACWGWGCFRAPVEPCRTGGFVLAWVATGGKARGPSWSRGGDLVASRGVYRVRESKGRTGGGAQDVSIGHHVQECRGRRIHGEKHRPDDLRRGRSRGA